MATGHIEFQNECFPPNMLSLYKPPGLQFRGESKSNWFNYTLKSLVCCAALDNDSAKQGEVLTHESSAFLPLLCKNVISVSDPKGSTPLSKRQRGFQAWHAWTFRPSVLGSGLSSLLDVRMAGILTRSFSSGICHWFALSVRTSPTCYLHRTRVLLFPVSQCSYLIHSASIIDEGLCFLEEASLEDHRLLRDLIALNLSGVPDNPQDPHLRSCGTGKVHAVSCHELFS